MPNQIRSGQRRRATRVCSVCGLDLTAQLIKIESRTLNNGRKTPSQGWRAPQHYKFNISREGGGNAGVFVLACMNCVEQNGGAVMVKVLEATEKLVAARTQGNAPGLELRPGTITSTVPFRTAK